MKAVSLYSGAGGFDIGLIKAGFDILWANDYNKDACKSYSKNIGEHIRCGDINDFIEELRDLRAIDVLIGGPPCQGFSVAGKMNPEDPRSKHVWTYSEAVKIIKPKVFVMENVKALGSLEKWKPLRESLLKKFRSMGYATNYVILNATNFDVPQKRERVFFIGFRAPSVMVPDLAKMLSPYEKKAKTVRETLAVLDRAGQGNNTSLCNAKITLASNPIMRKSPFAGMLFNGAGRPIDIDAYANTLPASMGGNKTPIIDDGELYDKEDNWVRDYHERLSNGEGVPKSKTPPKRLRRITVEEATLLQTFPKGYEFLGSQSSQYKQIGNAVPCNLAYSIGKMIKDYLEVSQKSGKIIEMPYQLKLGING